MHAQEWFGNVVRPVAGIPVSRWPSSDSIVTVLILNPYNEVRLIDISSLACRSFHFETLLYNYFKFFSFFSEHKAKTAFRVNELTHFRKLSELTVSKETRKLCFERRRFYFTGFQRWQPLWANRSLNHSYKHKRRCS